MVKRVGQSTKTTSVVFADLVGYSALCARNEAGTHEIWMDFVENCLQVQATKHQSSIIRLLGDGCLLEFDAPELALAWCKAVRQEVLDMREMRSSRWPSLSLRFGINHCNVIEDGGDIYGDGVNITKRLQERAQSDGVLVTADFHAQLDPETAAGFRYLGMLQYKEQSEPVSTYEAIFAGVHPAERKQSGPLPSVAILPFRNLTGDADLAYFSEGLIDDIIQSLTCLRELQVISRGSTLPYAGQTMDPREVSRILSVRYVLQGTMKTSPDKIHLSMVFEDAQTGETLFAEKCDFSHSKIFEVQDNIVRQIVSRITPNVRATELEKALRKPPSNFTSYQCYLQAIDLMSTLRREDFDRAKVYLETAIDLDDQFVLPLATMVRWYCVHIGQGWSKDRAAEVEIAKDYATRGLEIDRESPLALSAYGHFKSYLEQDLTTALVYFDRARQLGPSHALSWILSSATLCYMGKGEEAITHAKRALELSPNDQELFQFYDFLTLAHYACREFEHAMVWAKLSHAENPHYTSNLRQMVVCNMALAKKDEARHFAHELLKHDPGFNLTDYQRVCPFQDDKMRKRFFTHLQDAGLPLEAA